MHDFFSFKFIYSRLIFARYNFATSKCFIFGNNEEICILLSFKICYFFHAHILLSTVDEYFVSPIFTGWIIIHRFILFHFYSPSLVGCHTVSNDDILLDHLVDTKLIIFSFYIFRFLWHTRIFFYSLNIFRITFLLF